LAPIRAFCVARKPSQRALWASAHKIFYGANLPASASAAPTNAHENDERVLFDGRDRRIAAGEEICNSSALLRRFLKVGCKRVAACGRRNRRFAPTAKRARRGASTRRLHTKLSEYTVIFFLL
jgi:hypothetical protein